MFQKYKGLTRYLNTISFFDEGYLVPPSIFAARQGHSLLIIYFDSSNKSSTNIRFAGLDAYYHW